MLITRNEKRWVLEILHLHIIVYSEFKGYKELSSFKWDDVVA